MPLVASLPIQSAVQTAPRFFGFGCAGSCENALEVGGDFYEVLPLSENSQLLAVADVMGKGRGAAVFAGTLRTLLNALVEPDLCPARALTELNKLMFEELSSVDMFITIQLAVADLRHRELKVASAGHCPLLISTPNRRIETIFPDGLPLGISDDATYTCQTVPIPSFASVLLYTDGVTEARSRAGNFFGQQRLENWLQRASLRTSTADELKQSLLHELAVFQGGCHAADDQTFVILADETPRSLSGALADSSSWLLPYILSTGTAGAAHHSQ